MISDEAVKQYEGYIFLAMKRLHIYWDNEDQHQEFIDCGYDGIIKGLKGYDETKGFQPSTYIYKCIETELKRRIYLNTMKKRTTKVISLNTEIEGEELVEFIPDTLDVDAEVTRKILNEKIRELVNSLPKEKDRKVITLLYGLDGNEPLNMGETAKRMGVNRNAITSRRNKVFKILKEKIEKEGL